MKETYLGLSSTRSSEDIFIDNNIGIRPDALILIKYTKISH
jgi:hypothetical protein